MSGKWRLGSVWLMGCAVAAAAETMQLPAFPVPVLALRQGRPVDVGPVHLLRDLQEAGFRGYDAFDTADSDYALFRRDSVGNLTSWLDSACQSLGFDLRQARRQPYDGTVFARILETATSLAELQTRQRGLAMPIGVVISRRAAAWGSLPADGAEDVYLIMATDAGILVYDPPSRQLSALIDFPNRAHIVQIRF